MSNKNFFSTHDSIVILTDLEPDDVLAIHILSKHVNLNIPILVIVGESKVAKHDIGCGLMRNAGFNNFRVIQGPNSSKDYPIKIVTDLFQIDVKDVDLNSYDVFDSIVNFLKLSESPFILAIKPFTELFNIDRDLLKKCVFAVYGSFNFRCMFSSITPKDVADFVNNAFKYSIVYETYYVIGDQNSMNYNNARNIFDKLAVEAGDGSDRCDGNDSCEGSDGREGNNIVARDLLYLVEYWGDHIANDCLETAEQLSKDMNSKWLDRDWDLLRRDYDRLINRNLKVVGSIIEAKNKQFVLADFGLVALLVSNNNIDINTTTTSLKRGKIWFENGYTKFEQSDSNNSGTFMVMDIGLDKMVQIVDSVL